MQDNTFRIMSMSALDETMQRLQELHRQDTEVKQRADAQRDQIKRWEDKERGKLKEEIEYQDSLVQDFHSRLLLEDPKKKTLSTPFGKSKSRYSKAAPEQVDKDAILAHIQENNMRDFIKEEAKWGDFKKTLTVAELEGAPVVVDENGQVVPGVVVKPEAINYSVEITD
ncbi:hypothetical protein CSV71_14860 [Sporosarcina sp. P21c]|uniref:host-nuclease inhibitor Gam family protein n=1 Tax=Sporosarcina sp. P21c TaxID=2048255 RepID=UPI000C167868|nr:host-nuclease inhibitor Gam family protein [Sporosarcina sp. P21c]PIC88406.1 hypothetical protein CSV71_14860 [Sporosarcina sp. P21c]